MIHRLRNKPKHNLIYKNPKNKIALVLNVKMARKEISYDKRLNYVKKFKKSGLSARKFSKQNKISKSALSRWIKNESNLTNLG